MQLSFLLSPPCLTLCDYNTIHSHTCQPLFCKKV
nr:MAG TPA: hypothetical protein [Caudoviricetes sp.]DAP23902.1 MAG TPA: hypothetical protein [Caudoviricetes sp.]